VGIDGNGPIVGGRVSAKRKLAKPEEGEGGMHRVL
jgi:hypothetical protein